MSTRYEGWQLWIVTPHRSGWCPRRLDLLLGDIQRALPTRFLAWDSNRIANRPAESNNMIEFSIAKADDGIALGLLRREVRQDFVLN